MKKAIVLIDGENFLHKVKEVLSKSHSKKKVHEIPEIKLKALILNIFKQFPDIEITQINYYAAKLSVNKESEKKSKELIALQRTLKARLEKQGINFIYAGHVRAHKVKKDEFVFKEKGVDVRVAVDLAAFAFDKKYEIIILCSSDSDLQPAVHEAKERGAYVMYLGFGINPNKGLTVTTDKSVLLKDSDVLESIEVKKDEK